jgi:hypothetical protein
MSSYFHLPGVSTAAYGATSLHEIIAGRRDERLYHSLACTLQHVGQDAFLLFGAVLTYAALSSKPLQPYFLKVTTWIKARSLTMRLTEWVVARPRLTGAICRCTFNAEQLLAGASKTSWRIGMSAAGCLVSGLIAAVGDFLDNPPRQQQGQD